MKTKTFIFTILAIFAIFASCKENYDEILQQKKQLIIGTWKGGIIYSYDSVIIQFMEEGTAYLTYVNLQDSLYIDPPCLCTYSMRYDKYDASLADNSQVSYYLKIIRQELSCTNYGVVESGIVSDTTEYVITEINDSIMKIELREKGTLTEDDMFYCEIPGIWYPVYTATLYRINQNLMK